ncbi:hypothetical protein BDV40DRAFT_281247 [Aspergillus tamarii]|uniref:Uncharacterized protein n=1 Tax=Aspergillus tamarii TaxID=41984 RepID=A0A5N6UCW6_ASPTM|nr:hypothetical protein BDV40DRAFT_281247 [Aspergillus tamarii]
MGCSLPLVPSGALAVGMPRADGIHCIPYVGRPPALVAADDNQLPCSLPKMAMCLQGGGVCSQTQVLLSSMVSFIMQCTLE